MYQVHVIEDSIPIHSFQPASNSFWWVFSLSLSLSTLSNGRANRSDLLQIEIDWNGFFLVMKFRACHIWNSKFFFTLIRMKLAICISVVCVHVCVCVNFCGLWKCGALRFDSFGMLGAQTNYNALFEMQNNEINSNRVIRANSQWTKWLRLLSDRISRERNRDKSRRKTKARSANFQAQLSWKWTKLTLIYTQMRKISIYCLYTFALTQWRTHTHRHEHVRTKDSAISISSIFWYLTVDGHGTKHPTASNSPQTSIYACTWWENNIPCVKIIIMDWAWL